MKKVTVTLVLAALLALPGCAVRSYPRPVTAKEKAQTNSAFALDTAGAMLLSSINAGPRYPIKRQMATIDFQYYLDPRLRQDPRAFYPRPEAAPEVTVVEKLADTPEAEVFFLRWPSQYRPQNPAFAFYYAQYIEDQTAYAVYCKAKRGNRAAMVVSHGWTGGDIRKLYQAERPFEYAAMGYDTVMMQQPYHGLRAPAGSKFSGEYFFSGEVARSNEAMCQSVTDVRGLVMWLRSRYEVVGLKGGSLGGIATLQTAAVESDLDFAIAWVPPSSLGDLPPDSPLIPFINQGLRAAGLSPAQTREVLFVSSPTNFKPLIPKDNVLIVAGMGDNFVPTYMPARVWEAWDRPNIYWFAGGHAYNFELKESQEVERKFLEARLPKPGR